MQAIPFFGKVYLAFKLVPVAAKFSPSNFFFPLNQEFLNSDCFVVSEILTQTQLGHVLGTQYIYIRMARACMLDGCTSVFGRMAHTTRQGHSGSTSRNCFNFIPYP